MNITIYRAGQPVANLPIDENTTLSHQLMGEHRIALLSVVPAPVDIRIGDYMVHGNENYYMNTAPNVEKINNFTYSYNLVLEGEIYYLYNKLFLDEGAADFTYHGTPNDFLLLLLTNMEDIQSGWQIQEVEAAEAQLLSFNGDTCRTALTKIAEAFGMQYRLSGKNITLKSSVSIPTTLSFAYGRGNGLYTLQRNSIDRNNLVTKVYGFGAKTNIDVDYRDGASRLVFNARSLENNANIYGIREGSVTFDDIYPNRTGTVNQIIGADPLSIIDTSLDFDINDQLIEGTVAKIVFKTGELAGYEFEISKYDHASKKITFLPFTEENGYVLPNNTFKPSNGDLYTLVDITMPQIYIDTAEAELQQRTQQYLDEKSSPRVTYAISLDEKYVRDNAIELEVGHVVNVTDAALGVDADIRITAISYPLVAPDRIVATISDTLTYTLQERLIAETVGNTEQVRTIDLKRAELARKNASRFRELQDLVFDPDGYFNGENIKPNSIETLLLSVGAKSQNFGLNGVSIQANNGGNANSLVISAGQLVHYEIDIDGLGYVWQMDPATFNTLVSGSAYYVYARCSKTALTGTWQVSTTPKATEDEAGQYLFNVGILYAVADGRRDFDFTNGMTFINGDTITTGRIESLDGLNFFDLSSGQFKIGNGSSSLDWNVSTPGKLTLKGSLLQNAAGQDALQTYYRGAYSAPAFYSVNDLVTHNGGTWRCIQPIGGVAPPNGTYWVAYVEKGADGANGQDGSVGPSLVYRGDFENGMTLYNNDKRQDAVKRLGVYYIFIGTDAQVQSSFVSSRYQNFGAQFESVATNLLLAENANIADWIIVDGKISSQQEHAGEPMAQLDGDAGSIELQGPGTVYSQADGAETTTQRVNISAAAARVRMQHDPTSTQIAGDTIIDSNGLIATFAGKSAGTGAKAAVYGYGRARLDLIGDPNAQAVVGVYGKAQNVGTGSTQAPAFGGMFESLMAKGLYLNTRNVVGGTTSLNQDDVFIYATGGTINLPIEKANLNGRTLIIWAKNTVTVSGSGSNIELAHLQGGSPGTPISLTNQVALFIKSQGIWRATLVD